MHPYTYNGFITRIWGIKWELSSYQVEFIILKMIFISIDLILYRKTFLIYHS